MLSLSQCATLACLLEVTAPKPGNVHRGADFEDLSFSDFVTSAVVVGPIVEQAATLGVGPAILQAVQATREAVGTNTNLGMLLLLVPLAAVPREEPLASGIGRVLRGLTPGDAAAIYQAIQTAQAGGLGQVPEHDVAGSPPANLHDAMRMAADRDLIARQYTTDFDLVLKTVVPRLQAGRTSGWTVNDTIIHTQLTLLAEFSDSLIARKCGPQVAADVQHWAKAVLAAGGPTDDNYENAVADLDFWLRADGHRRNPGTTADLIAAGLFAVLRENGIPFVK